MRHIEKTSNSKHKTEKKNKQKNQAVGRKYRLIFKAYRTK